MIRHGKLKGALFHFEVPESGAGVIDEVILDDCYEIENIPKGGVVYDIGANIGAFAILCANVRGCRVYAFEPSFENYKRLRHNIELNKSEALVFPIHAAIGSCAEVRDFLYRPEHPAGSQFLSGVGPGIMGETERVACLTMDSVFVSGIVKLDCEGAETEIFESLHRWGPRCSQLIMEWHNHDGWEFRDKLIDGGFDVRLTGGGPKPRPEYDRSIGGGLLYATRTA